MVPVVFFDLKSVRKSGGEWSYGEKKQSGLRNKV